MAIVVLSDGATITAADIEQNVEHVRDAVNGMNASRVRRQCFGPQHLPGIISRKLVGTTEHHAYTTTLTNSIINNALGFGGIEDINIRTTWEIALELGAGYALPACKVLVWAYIELEAWSTDGNEDPGLIALTRQIDGGLEAKETKDDWGFVLNEENTYIIDNPLITALAHSRYGHYPMAITSIIDMTPDDPAGKNPAAANWTLTSLRLRAARDVLADSWIIDNGCLGFVALHRDN
jgi:hypothetical protein